MHCIRCKQEMAKKKYKGVLVDYCKTCDAFWLDDGELEMLARGEMASVEQIHQEARREIQEEQRRPVVVFSSCPKCQEGQILERRMDGVKIDYCDSCKGLYFDHGELSAVLGNREKSFFDRMLANLFRK